jgi:hypothetical protein
LNDEAAIAAPAAPRVLGEFQTFEQLQPLLRARAEELQLSREQIDEIAGFCQGFANKLLAPRPTKKLGTVSLPLMIGALAVRLVVVEDAEQRAKIAARGLRRVQNLARHANSVHTFIHSARHMRRVRKLGGQNSRKYLPPAERTRLARKAAFARWRDIKKAVREPTR